MRRGYSFVPDDVKTIHSGVEERYLGRLITSRPRFDSGPRNKNEKEQVYTCSFSFYGCGGKRANCLALVGIEQTEPCRSATGEFGEEVLNERSEFRNLTLDSGPRNKFKRAGHAPVFLHLYEGWNRTAGGLQLLHPCI